MLKPILHKFIKFLYARLQTGRIIVWWCPSVRPSVRPGLRPSVRPSQFSALFSYMLWHIELKFCICLCFTVLQIKFECRQFASFLWELCPFWNLEYLKYTVSRTFLLHPLTYRAESLHIILFFCTTDWVWVSSICVYFGVMPLFELRIL